MKIKEDLEFIRLFEKIQKESHDGVVEKGFWNPEPKILELISLVHSELSEAVEAYRNGNPKDDKIPPFTGIEAELADVVLRIMSMAEGYNLDIAGAIIKKNEYNKTRKYKKKKVI